MADISISKFRTTITRQGATPSTPGFAESEGQDPVNPNSGGVQYGVGAGLSLDPTNRIQFGKPSPSVSNGIALDLKDYDSISKLIISTDYNSWFNGDSVNYGNIDFREISTDISRQGEDGSYSNISAWNDGSTFNYLKLNVFDSLGSLIGIELSEKDTNKLLVVDQISLKGLVNDGDYESNFTARSLVTKQYVDSAISGAGHNPVTIGSPANGLSITAGQVLSLGLASAGVTGALSGSDWSTFNGKIGGTGTIGYIPKFTGTGAIGNSIIFDYGSYVTINGTSTLSNNILRVTLSNSSDQTVAIQGYNNRGFSVGHNQFGGLYGFHLDNDITNARSYGTAIHMNARYNGTNYISQNSSIRPQLLLLRDGDFRFYRSDPVTVSSNITLTEIVSITNEGTLGIGVPEPTNTLDVNGTARIRSIANSTGNFLTVSATGVVQQRTAAETLTDIGGIGGTLTSGRIPFATGASTLSDVSSFVYDSVNNRVGIGTPSPLSILHIRQQSIGLEAIDFVEDSTHGILLVEDEDARLGLYSRNEGGHGSTILLGEVNSSVFQDLWSIGRFSSGFGSYLDFRYGDTNDYTINPLMFRINPSNQNVSACATLNTANFGIGTNIPTNKLQINLSDSSGSPFSNGIYINNIYTGAFGSYASLLFRSGSQNQGVTGFISVSYSAFNATNGGGGDMLFGTKIETEASPVERWRITKNGILRSNGTQTIQSSTGDLTISSGGGNGNVLLSPNGTGIVSSLGDFQVNRSVVESKINIINNGLKKVFFHRSSDRTFGIYNDETDEQRTQLRIVTGFGSSNDRMRLLETGGQVGIATTSPTNTLDVNGTARIRSIANGVGNFLTKSATGVITERTAAEVASDIGAGIWTLTGSDIYRDSRVAIGRNTLPTNSTLTVRSKGAINGNSFILFERSDAQAVLSINNTGSCYFNNTDFRIGNPATNATLQGLTVKGSGTTGQDVFRLLSPTETIILSVNNAGSVTTANPILRTNNASTNAISTGATFKGSANSNSIFRILNNSNEIVFDVLGDSDIKLYRNIILPTTTGTKIGLAPDQKLGIWGATPIVQPTTAGASGTLVSNAGTTLTSTDTIDGYTLQQVVRALRNAGLLA